MNSTTCRCKTGYTWNAATKKCDLNCTSIPGATQLSNISCGCTDARYYFNPATPGCAINCSQVSGSTGVAATGTTPRCICIAGYGWNATSLTCELDCTLIANSLGTKTNGACDCQQGYFWNTLASECNVNCTSFAFSEEGILENFGCVCVENFYWVYTPAPGLCYLDCANNYGFTDDPADPANCICGNQA